MLNKDTLSMTKKGSPCHSVTSKEKIENDYEAIDEKTNQEYSDLNYVCPVSTQDATNKEGCDVGDEENLQNSHENLIAPTANESCMVLN